MTFNLCLNRFAEEVLELAFCWNEQFVPHLKWRVAHFYRLPICPVAIQQGLAQFWGKISMEAHMQTALTIELSIKYLMKDLYHLSPTL